MRIERHIDDETKELIEEGRRRVREYEGIAPVVKDQDGKTVGFLIEGEVKSGCVGTHRMVGGGMPIRKGVLLAAEAADSFDLYLPTEKDQKKLQQELSDLVRDLSLYEKHERVKYDS